MSLPPAAAAPGGGAAPPDTAADVLVAGEAEATARIQAAARAIFQRGWDAYVAHRARALAAAAPQIAALGGTDLLIGVVPRQERALAPLPAARRAAFEAHLDAILAEPDPEPGPEPEPAPEPALVGATCAACQGACCTLGGARHAFLAAGDIARHRRRHPGATAAQIRAHYLGALPDRSVIGACVFQGAAGCTLDRADRAPVCNRYHCNGQTDLLVAMREAGARQAVIVAFEPGTDPVVRLFEAAAPP